MNKIIVQGLLVLSLIVAGCSSVPELTKKEKAVNRILTLDSLTWDFGKAGDQPNKGLFVRTGFAADTTFHIKNNLFYSSEQMRQKQIDFDESSGTRLITWSYVDGNAWGSLCDYNNDLLNVTGNTGTPFTMAELNAKGAELSGAPANRWNKVPIFVNYGLYDYRQQSNSPYYNVGANIQAEVEKVLPVGIPYAPIYGTKVTP
jgi:hypothetical protein